MELEKIGSVLAFIGAVVTLFWSLGFIFGNLPYQGDIYYHKFKLLPFLKGLYLLVASGFVFWGAALMKKPRMLMKGSIIVVVASLLSVGGVVGLIGGILGIIAAKKGNGT